MIQIAFTEFVTDIKTTVHVLGIIRSTFPREICVFIADLWCRNSCGLDYCFSEESKNADYRFVIESYVHERES